MDVQSAAHNRGDLAFQSSHSSSAQSPRSGGGGSTASMSMSLPIRLEPRMNAGSSHAASTGCGSTPTRRARSSSKVFGKGNPLVSTSTQTVDLPKRDHFAHILVFVSLNETFDKKTLTIPQYPQVLKLGRPNNAQKSPSMYNGYFDSRVISREHAELYWKNGKVYLKDCRSANGTFINGQKIVDEVELHKADSVDLGIDIDNETNNKNQLHRKISCKVETILTVPLESTTDLDRVLKEISGGEDPSVPHKSIVDKMDSFDAAVFGDVTRDLEEVALGANHDFLSGIFVNNNIGTSSNLIHSIRLLIAQLHKEKMNNLKLASIQGFLADYERHLHKSKEDSINLGTLEKKVHKLKDKLETYQRDNVELGKTVSLQSDKLEELKSLVQEKDMRIHDLNSIKKREVDVYLDRIEQLQRLLDSKNKELDDVKQSLGLQIDEQTTKLNQLELSLKEKDSKNKLLQEELKLTSSQQVWQRRVLGDMVHLGITVGSLVILTSIVLKFL